MRTHIVAFIIIMCAFTCAAHPLKMAYTSVKYNAQKQVFEITHRVFQDDFEATLRSKYGYTGGDVFTHQHTPLTQRMVNAFFEKNFSISFDGRSPRLTYIKTEQKHQMGIIVYYETGKITAEKIRSISIYNYIMMESFKEQVNMFHLNINEAVKRTVKFGIDKSKETITL